MIIFIITEVTMLSLNKDNVANFIQILRDNINHFGAIYKTYVWYKHQDSISRVLKVLTSNYYYEAYDQFQPESILINGRNHTLKIYKAYLLVVNVLWLFITLIDINFIFNTNLAHEVKIFPNFGGTLKGKIIFICYHMIAQLAYAWIIVCK